MVTNSISYFKLNLINENDKIKRELDLIKSANKSFEILIKSSADATQVSTLAVVVEEQRLRIDSILHGSTNIDWISKQFKKNEIILKEIKSYLQLPQLKPLRNQLDEAGHLIEGFLSKVIFIAYFINNQY